jgi:hypothetical protein
MVDLYPELCWQDSPSFQQIVVLILVKISPILKLTSYPISFLGVDSCLEAFPFFIVAGVVVTERPYTHKRD